MTKKLLVVALALCAADAAEAATYVYACKESGKKGQLKVDDTKNTLDWKGTTYKITKTDCGKAGWHAEKDGVGFDFCTATKGVADFELNGKTVMCDMKR